MIKCIRIVDRYQGGEKPAWLLEIEEARATSSGAIGQSEAWAGNQRQPQQQQQPEQQEKQNDEQTEKQKDEEEEKATEEVRPVGAEAVQSEQVTTAQPAAATEPLPERPDDQPVTSEQPVNHHQTSPTLNFTAVAEASQVSRRLTKILSGLL